MNFLHQGFRVCVHLVTRGHFRLRDKDGGQAIRSTVSENPYVKAFESYCFTYIHTDRHT